MTFSFGFDIMKYDITHVAIIPDGNRRWAKSKGKPAFFGHRHAVITTLPALYDKMLELKISFCTFWVMSPENFKKRSTFEINSLLKLLSEFIDERLTDFNKKNIRVLAIGDLDSLPSQTRKQIARAIESTKINSGLNFIFAVNYGGRDEIKRAVKKGGKDFIKFLDTKGVPDPDLIIRTGGEKRTSGFLLWQSEYTEYIFLEKMFPDFSPDDLVACLEEYTQRKRRYGK